MSENGGEGGYRPTQQPTVNTEIHPAQQDRIDYNVTKTPEEVARIQSAVDSIMRGEKQP
ncbi:hypothetical protein BH09PAT2_BH09PAT2_00160 [soil metagenome]